MRGIQLSTDKKINKILVNSTRQTLTCMSTRISTWNIPRLIA